MSFVTGFFHLHNVFKIHSCCSIYQYFIPFYWWITFLVRVSHLAYPFSNLPFKNKQTLIDQRIANCLAFSLTDNLLIPSVIHTWLSHYTCKESEAMLGISQMGEEVAEPVLEAILKLNLIGMTHVCVVSVYRALSLTWYSWTKEGAMLSASLTPQGARHS